MSRAHWRLWLAAVVVAWSFDFLFWGKNPGISLPIWITALLAAGLVLALLEGRRPNWRSYALMAGILALAWMSAFRLEEFTRFLSVSGAVVGLFLLAASFQDGYYPFFSLKDNLVESLKVFWAGWSQPASRLGRETGEEKTEAQPKRSLWKTAGPILLGIVLALPILLILGSLLASADPVFKTWLEKLFNIEKIIEQIFRLVYILIIGYWLAGVLMYILGGQKKREKPDALKPWMPAFLNSIPLYVVMGSVILLFTAFMVVQVRYLYGGEANITAAGFTYSEYARRGFFELVTVAVMSLGLYLVGATVTRLDTSQKRRLFSGLAIVLLGLVVALLVSSLKRLMLYEAAYGWSELRTYTHFFIFWLAGVLAAAVVLEVVQKRGWLAPVIMLAAFSFALTLGVMNVDGFIARQNIQRAMQGEELDAAYLGTLSLDATPTLVDAWKDASLPKGLRQQLGAAVACQSIYLKEDGRPWQSYHFSRAKGTQLLKETESDWEGLINRSTDGSWHVIVDGKILGCQGRSYED